MRRRFDLAAEPRLLFGTGMTARQNHLERDDAIQAALPCLEDDPHAATRDLGEDLDEIECPSLPRVLLRTRSTVNESRSVGVVY